MKWSRWTSSVMEQVWIMFHLIGCNENTESQLWYSCQGVEPESNQEKTWDKFKLRNILQNNWPVNFKSVKTMKVKDKLRTALEWKIVHIYMALCIFKIHINTHNIYMNSGRILKKTINSGYPWNMANVLGERQEKHALL